MAVDTVLTYAEIANLRYNSFTEVFTPNLIGYGANDPEIRTIPTDAPFIINLFEAIQENAPSTTEITVVSSGLKLVEVSKASTLANNEYQVNYDDLGNAQVQFGSNLAGVQVSIKYYGLGTNLQKSTLSTRLIGVNTKMIASTDSTDERTPEP
jgi:hypothetical protein